MRYSSLEWMVMNLGGFSQFTTLQQMYLLNPQFNAVSKVISAHAYLMMDIIIIIIISFTISNSCLT